MGLTIEQKQAIREKVAQGTPPKQVSGNGYAPAPAPAPAPVATATDATRVKASPLARRIAKDAGVDLKLVQGSGPGGRGS